jgi:hypothetical protein
MRSHRQGWIHLLIFTLLVGQGSTSLLAQATASSTTKTTTTTAPPAAAATPAAATAPAAELFSKEQLEQLVAPIALYPDALLAQIFMASTYPLEVVEAERFMTANASLKGTALDEKLKEYDWQAEIKALCLMPEVLKKMSENLDWTQDLGDAFLGQKSQLMDTVQVMRNKAYDSGNLKSTEQQTIKVENTVNVQPAGGATAAPSGSDGDQIIIIESSSPEVVYVPQYAPTAVYPGWSYPSYYYPPMYPYYPPGAGLITFGVGMAVGAAIWGNCNWGGGWGGGDVDIDINRNNNFNRNTSINGGNRPATTGARGGKQSFQHNAAGRKGVNYGNSKVAGQYGAKAGTNRVSKGQGTASAQARGRSGTSASSGSRQARTPSATTQGARGQAGSGQGAAGRDPSGSGAARSGDRASGAKASGDRAASAKASGAGQRSSGSKASSYSGSGSGRSAYGGSSSSHTSRASSSRGASSRGSTSYGGGGSRGGGGGGRGGGGGGRRR